METNHLLYDISESRWIRRVVYGCYDIHIKQERKQITYVSRCCNTRRHNTNEDEVMKCLNLFNMTAVMVKFDNATFEEQVRIMADTLLLVSIHGSQLTNMVFMVPRSAVIEIVNPLFNYWFFKELSERSELFYSLFQGTTIAEDVPYEVRRTWWCLTVDYNTIVNTTLLYPVVRNMLDTTQMNTP